MPISVSSRHCHQGLRKCTPRYHPAYCCVSFEPLHIYILSFSPMFAPKVSFHALAEVTLDLYLHSLVLNYPIGRLMILHHSVSVTRPMGNQRMCANKKMLMNTYSHFLIDWRISLKTLHRNIQSKTFLEANFVIQRFARLVEMFATSWRTYSASRLRFVTRRASRLD